MAWLRVLMVVAGALAVLTLGALASHASAAPGGSCHEVASTHHQPPPSNPDPTPVPATQVMICCLACSPSAPTPVMAKADLPRAAQSLSIRRANLPLGQHPAPEPGPPRAAVS